MEDDWLTRTSWNVVKGADDDWEDDEITTSPSFRNVDIVRNTGEFDLGLNSWIPVQFREVELDISLKKLIDCYASNFSCVLRLYKVCRFKDHVHLVLQHTEHTAAAVLAKCNFLFFCPPPTQMDRVLHDDSSKWTFAAPLQKMLKILIRSSLSTLDYGLILAFDLDEIYFRTHATLSTPHAPLMAHTCPWEKHMAKLVRTALKEKEISERRLDSFPQNFLIELNHFIAVCSLVMKALAKRG